MSQPKLLFLDIDGTILTPDHTIQDSTIEAIEKVKAKGIDVFLATGRPLLELKDVKNQLNIHSAIGYNGAYAIYQGEEIYQAFIPESLVNHYVSLAKKLDHELVLYTKDKNLFTSTEPDHVNKFIQHFQITHNDTYNPDYANEILGITLLNVQKDEIIHYKTQHSIFFSQVNVEGLMNNYDVIQASVNKGKAIEFVLDRLGFTAEEAIAFGDGLNDREMLSTVKYGFAMGNAHPDLFDFANYTTTSVQNDGIYNGLKKLNVID
ncbi:hypothetical protein SAMN05421734_106148 [Pelagirhabdus alkalitolerans]|uniref:Cof subfamily of IIB subfamily of haloacid dehalogenase superfamily/HAD-superfamily hydrolase, subfamily IIB n=1 Tax=Pelagirhabdus alkalitolerans TaxID=1612202 RepID=A0A1G6KNR3_9BACI|nr:Cof-type HAD-IIB family hydrolase [Pelagirhabdus alkalitolerans]SDC32478.1 hypothetical protein SAMN05421734_106148 [Pelagirhabdus alkalitolerans]